MNESPAECVRLAAELRALRARSGLSLAALGAESAYSKSSWERYLNGKALPPWPAVLALCRLAGEPEAKARALWELAESAWRGRGVVAAGGGPAPTAEPPSGPAEPPPTDGVAPTAERRPLRRRWAVAATALCAVLVLATVTAGAARQWDSDRTALPPPSLSPTAAPTDFQIRCEGSACQGKDPQVMMCAVVPDTLLQLQTASGAGLEIRYNQQCRAAWARAWTTQVGDQLTITAPGEPGRSVLVTDAYLAQTFVYTSMVSVGGPNTPLRICLTAPAHGSSQCFTVRSP